MGERLFAEQGFHWGKSTLPASTLTHSIERACFRFHRMQPEFVWDVGILEGNLFTMERPLRAVAPLVPRP